MALILINYPASKSGYCSESARSAAAQFMEIFLLYQNAMAVRLEALNTFH